MVTSHNISTYLLYIRHIKIISFDLNNNIASEIEMVEQQINEFLFVTNHQTIFSPNVRKTRTQLHQETCDVAEQCFFQLGFIVLIPDSGKGEIIGILSYFLDQIAFW